MTTSESNLDYQYDNCYYLNPTFKSDNSYVKLNDFLNTNFNKKVSSTLDNNLNECKEFARTNQKDFFLVSNLKQNIGTIDYTCYVPKVDDNCDFSNISDFVSPFNEILKKLLGLNENTRKEVNSDTGFFQLTNADYQSLSSLNKNKFNNAKCFNYNNDSNFGKIDTKNENNSTFALYKTDIILDENNDNNIFNNAKYTNM